MGLTAKSTGSNLIDENDLLNSINCDFTIGLAGNPNVGKSTVFNGLTGMHQHTGNWPGKTVGNAVGEYKCHDKTFLLVDIPGTYSLMSNSEEEEIARDYICSGNSDVTVVVLDATSLERNLNLAIQIMNITDNVIICVNLLDQAKKKGIHIDFDLFSELLGVPVVGITARKPKTLKHLTNTIYDVCTGKVSPCPKTFKFNCKTDSDFNNDNNSEIVSKILKEAEEICSKVCTYDKQDYNERDRKIDKILTSKIFGIPIMLLFLGIIFWLTIEGANYPSQLLSKLFAFIQGQLYKFFEWIHAPSFVTGLLVDGMYQTLAWVVSVMLPPMAIFFPLFTFLEDLGYLPRIAFNLDNCFKKCCASGKQALTMCMGFGCNAAGVVGCRIINSTREKLIAILTNAFVPCNGRFPLLITIATIFIGGLGIGFGASILSTLTVLLVILLGIFMTFIISKILSKTVLKGMPSSFTLELPPYRKPQIGKIIIRSIFDRALFVLGRAISVAAPTGLVIWLFANIGINNISLLEYIANFFEPFARLMGFDGYILTAFILGIPANEIVLPILLMSYLKTNALVSLEDTMQIGTILVQNGWTILTAINVMIFTLLHFPCATTLLTIKKETGSKKWTLLAFALPTVCGVVLCMFTTLIYNVIF